MFYLSWRCYLITESPVKTDKHFSDVYSAVILSEHVCHLDHGIDLLVQLQKARYVLIENALYLIIYLTGDTLRV